MIKKHKYNSSLSITPLGGVREIGKNCFIIECDDEAILVDAGLIFPTEDYYGVDVIIPNFEYLLERSANLKGIILTHGHEDHIGALPYLFREINRKMYATSLTTELIRNKFVEEEKSQKLNFKVIKAGDEFKIGKKFKISTAALNHSIPAGLGLRITTPAGTIVHSGDFKLDQTPLNNELTDLRRFGEWGEDGVDILIIDVTNVYNKGYTKSERIVGRTFDALFEHSSGRIFVAMFSSHFHRIQQAIDSAEAVGRKLVILGRSMILNIKTAGELGYLRIPKGMIVEPDAMDSIPDNKLLVIATGSQGEPMSVLTRMAAGEHRIGIKEGDRVILSANPIPGNETAIGKTINRLFDLGADVITSVTEEVHVSGHASREEIKILYNAVHPEYVMPYHGESRHFMEFKNLMIKMGVSASNIILTSPGDRVRLQDGVSVQKGVTGGEQLVRGAVVEDEWTALANDRSQMAAGGVIVARLNFSRKKRKIEKVELESRGVVNRKKWKHVFDRAETSLMDSLGTVKIKNFKNKDGLKERAEQKLYRLFLKHTGIRPLIIVIVNEVK